MPPQRGAKPGFAPSSIIERAAQHLDWTIAFGMRHNTLARCRSFRYGVLLIVIPTTVPPSPVVIIMAMVVVWIIASVVVVGIIASVIVVYWFGL
jgi:hypothetical protein